MSGAERIEPFDNRRHAVTEFDCGEPSLDRWLIRYASQGERRDTSRTFVAVHGDERVIGYYTLAASKVVQAAATRAVAAGTSRHLPIPVCLLARLAVDRSVQGQGLGSRLVIDALARAVAGSSYLAVRAVVVEAIDENAARFYREVDFEPLADDPLTLMIPLAAIRKML